MCKKKIIAFFCASPTQLSFRHAPSAHPGLTERVVGTQAAPKASLCILPPYNVQMEGRHRRVMAQRAGCKTVVQFGKPVLGYRIRFAPRKYGKLSDAKTSAISRRPELSALLRLRCSDATPDAQQAVAHHAPIPSVSHAGEFEDGRHRSRLPLRMLLRR